MSAQAVPLLLVPGLLCDAAVWAPQCEALASRARCVVARHGLADSIEGMARQALDLMPQERFALAGHSMGGRVALEILRLAPARVTRVALLDTGYQALAPGAAGEREATQRHALLDIARTRGMRAMGEQWARGMVHPARLGTPVHEAVLQIIERATPEVFAAQIKALLARPDATVQLQQLAQRRVPTLLLVGREDHWSPVARHVEMQALVPGSTLAVVEDCGHMSTMEQPEAVTDKLARWLGLPLPDAA